MLLVRYLPAPGYAISLMIFEISGGQLVLTDLRPWGCMIIAMKPGSHPMILLFTNSVIPTKIANFVSCQKFGIIPLDAIDSSDRAGT
jgi:hypothetical protein